MSADLEATTSIVLAAGKGSRMQGYGGNKTLLPLVPGASPYVGERPLLLEVLANLPPGPKGIVVHHCAKAVRQATAQLPVAYIVQPATNGTGGALLAARFFLEEVSSEKVVITMGDVPLIRPETYRMLLERLATCDLQVLAFRPEDKGRYGVLELHGDRVLRITEWEYWHRFPAVRQAELELCNAGVYAAKRTVLLGALDRFAARPHRVRKERDGQWVEIEEYFLTDLVEMLSSDGRAVGFVVTDEEEVLGVDTSEALRLAQGRYALRRGIGVLG
jgi:bifunctional N-acetylglucosamine-1-phosphate-uridyltransferase/glucosamine-1-phosphate-acetyltransferase GlmU-like protein